MTKPIFYKFAFLVSLFLALLFFTKATIAASLEENIINQQDWITRNQQNILEEKKRNSEFENIEKEHQRKKKEESEKPSSPTFQGNPEACFSIKEIHLINANLLSETQQKKLTASFINKCMEAEVLSDIIKTVKNYYHRSGYVTTQIKIPKQNLQSGIFELEIIEGKIEKISFEKDRFIDKMQKFTAFGNLEESNLNINDINQGLYQINRLRSNSAIMKVEPGSESGKSNILITNNKTFPAKFTIGKDNLGNQFTGTQRTSFSSSFDNLLFLNDNLNLNYTTNLHDKNRIKDSTSFSANLSIPFKYNSFSYDYSHSEFKGQNPGQNGPTTLNGFSDQQKITLDRVFLSNTNFRLSSYISLSNKRSASYLNGEKNINSERELSILNLGFSLSSYLNNSTNLYFRPSYSRGLKILNAKKDQANESANTPKAQFDVFKLYANFSKKFILPKTSIPLTFISEMDSQFAKQTLYGSEQFAVGGYYSVRGFRETYITGDSGYYFRNKMNVNLGSLISPFAKASSENPKNFLQKNLHHLNKISFEPFFDYGYVKNKYNGSDGRLSGAGIKTIFNSRFLSASLTYSQGLNKSNLVTSNIKENKIIYFEISASCC